MRSRLPTRYRVGERQNRFRRARCQRCKARLQLGFVVHWVIIDPDAEALRHFLRTLPFEPLAGVIRACQDRDAFQVGPNIAEQFEPLGVEFSRQQGNPGAVAARPRQALGEARLDRIGAEHKDHRNRARILDDRTGRDGQRHDDVDAGQFVNHLGNAVGRAVTVADIEDEVTALDVT